MSQTPVLITNLSLSLSIPLTWPYPLPPPKKNKNCRGRLLLTIGVKFLCKNRNKNLSDMFCCLLSSLYVCMSGL